MKIALQSKNIVGSSFHKEGILLIENGKIKGIFDSISPNEVDIFEDFGDALIMPGLVDTHVHVNEPGRTGRPSTDIVCSPAPFKNTL